MKIGIVAGEKSGDYIGSQLIVAIKKHYPKAEFIGLAGPLMIEQGATSLDEMDKISIMGFDGLLSSIGEILAIRKRLFNYFKNNSIDVFVGIDVPDFNLVLEKKLKQLGIPVVHYVSPTVWAWRGGRINKIRKSIDLMLALFPFEENYYQKQGIPVQYVGHPLASEIEQCSPDSTTRAAYAKPDETLMAILPGSRMSEVSRLASTMFSGAVTLKKKYPELCFVVPAANDKLANYLQQVLARYPDLNECLTIENGNSRRVLANCDITVLASGTAALEAALFAKPMVVMYRVSWASLVMVKMTRTVDYFSMPNHLTDTPVVPELMQDNATSDNLVNEVSKLLDDEVLFEQTKKTLATILPRLKTDSGELASQAIFSLLDTQLNSQAAQH